MTEEEAKEELKDQAKLLSKFFEDEGVIRAFGNIELMQFKSALRCM